MVSSCARSAVDVSVPAEASSWFDGGGYGLDDLSDRALEIVGHLVHVRLAQRNGAGLGFLLLGLQSLPRDRVALEDLDRLGHFADLVVAVDAGHLDVELAAGQIIHRHRHALQRAGNAASHQDRHGERQQQHQAGGQQR